MIVVALKINLVVVEFTQNRLPIYSKNLSVISGFELKSPLSVEHTVLTDLLFLVYQRHMGWNRHHFHSFLQLPLKSLALQSLDSTLNLLIWKS